MCPPRLRLSKPCAWRVVTIAAMKDLPLRAWREVATDWKVWLSLALCLLIATIAWLMGFD